MRLLVMLVLAAALFGAQAPTPPDIDAPGPDASRFDVVSVKASDPGAPGLGIRYTPGRLTATGVLVREYIRNAFPATPLDATRLLGLPGWADRERFDVMATTHADSSPVERGAMMRSLLGERFGLRGRWERRPMRVHVLSRARADGSPGPGLRVSTADCTATPSPCVTRNRPGAFHAVATQWPGGGLILGELRTAVGTPVIDRTALAGVYDIDLEWATSTTAQEQSDLPQLVTAVREQLGLRLDPSTEPLDVFVVDQIDRPTPD